VSKISAVTSARHSTSKAVILNVKKKRSGSGMNNKSKAKEDVYGFLSKPVTRKKKGTS